MYKMDAKGVLSNLKGWNQWEFGTYKLRKEEAEAIVEALEEKSQIIQTESSDAYMEEGDVVMVSQNDKLIKMIVTHVNYKENRITCMSSKGLLFPFSIEEVKKTGKSYPQLLQIMQQLEREV